MLTSPLSLPDRFAVALAAFFLSFKGVGGQTGGGGVCVCVRAGGGRVSNKLCDRRSTSVNTELVVHVKQRRQKSLVYVCVLSQIWRYKAKLK